MRADGSEFPIELAITRVGLPGPPLFSGCIRDLTAQHDMRPGLVKSEERLRAILDNSPAIIWLTDAGGRFLVVNRGFEDANGFAPGSATRRTPEELWPRRLPEAPGGRTERAEHGPAGAVGGGRGPARRRPHVPLGGVPSVGCGRGTVRVGGDLDRRLRQQARGGGEAIPG